MAPLAHLPAPLTALIGREDDLARVQALLLRPDIRQVTFTSSGGVGKTRLAIHVATSRGNRFDDGVVLVHLEDVQSPDIVLPAIA